MLHGLLRFWPLRALSCLPHHRRLFWLRPSQKSNLTLLFVELLSFFLLIYLLGVFCRLKVFVKHHKVVRLGTITRQLVMLLQETHQLARRSIVCHRVCLLSFFVEHELKYLISNSLPLQRLMHVKVQNTSWLNILHRCASYVQALFSRLEDR